jgi:mRNA-degrading endonuclease toxin of MazEF toxin-antitoxin module
MAKRGEVFLVTLDPTVGAEMQKDAASRGGFAR